MSLLSPRVASSPRTFTRVRSLGSVTCSSDRLITRVIDRVTGTLAADNVGMSPPLSTPPVSLLSLWKRWGRGEADSTDESVISAAALSALNHLGAALSLLWLVLPHPGGAQEPPIACATLAEIRAHHLDKPLRVNAHRSQLSHVHPPQLLLSA